MYRTQLGERVLGDKEAIVFKEMVRQLLVWFDPRDEESRSEEGMTSFGISVFDRMSFGQKLWSLNLVTKALLLESIPCPPLHAFVEATVATIFSQADVLLDMEKEGDSQVAFRSMLIEAATEICDGFEGSDVQELGFEFAVESLEESILWDNDHLDFADSIDKEPESTKHFHKMMGIPDDYFVEIAKDPADHELRALFNELLQTIGDGGLPIQRIVFMVRFTATPEGLEIVESKENGKFVTDGVSFLKPDIKFWTDGSPELIDNCIWNSNWQDGASKPTLELNDEINIKDGLFSVKIEFVTYAEKGECRLVQCANHPPFLKGNQDTSLILPSIVWMKAQNDDIDSNTMIAVDMEANELTRKLWEHKVSEEHEIFITEAIESKEPT